MNVIADYPPVAECVRDDSRPFVNPYATGYGSRIPTPYSVRLEGARRWRRVWAMSYSNVAVYYCIIRGEGHVIDDSIFNIAESTEANHE